MHTPDDPDDLSWFNTADPTINTNANTNAKNKRKKTTPFNDDDFKNMIHRNVLDPNNPDHHFTTLASKVEPIPHSKMKGFETPYIDRFWGDDKPLQEFGSYNPEKYPILNSNKKQKRSNGGKKQKTNKKIKSKKNKKRSKRTRKNRKSKK